ncbi:MAG: AAA family ATPase [Chloroflexi bacterium]|nr:AAA family ATPase [Chloroflexota bacterium]MBU1748780.1 AAA family ATPase [Chloroflexota bacterium]
MDAFPLHQDPAAARPAALAGVEAPPTDTFTLVLGLRSLEDNTVFQRVLEPGGAAAHTGIKVVAVARTAQQVWQDVTHYDADMVVLCRHIEGFQIDLIPQLLHRPGKPTITTCGYVAGEDSLDLFSAGAVSVFPLPAAPQLATQICAALPGLLRQVLVHRGSENYVAQSQAMTATVAQASWTKSVIALWSPKGGVGKTTIATNVAVALALGGAKVLLVDVDLTRGSAHNHLNIRPDKNLFGLAARYESAAQRQAEHQPALPEPIMTPRLVQEFALPMPGTYNKLMLIPGIYEMPQGGKSCMNDQMGLRFMTDLVDTARRIYDFVILDLGIDYNKAPVLASLKEADHILIPVIPDRSCIDNVKYAIQPLCDVVGIGRDKFQLVFNAWTDEAGVARKDAVEWTGLPSKGLIPFDDDFVLKQALNVRGYPLVLDGPNRIANALVELATQFYPPLTPVWRQRGGFRDEQPGLGRRVATALFRR